MEHLPPERYYASLPKAIAGAAAFMYDPDGRVLLVKPSYRDDWGMPGGAMDPGEYPWETARREVGEELAIDLAPGRLLAVDWVLAQPDGRPPLVNFVFDGGPITEADAVRRVRLPADELTGWRLAGPEQWDGLLLPRIARRLRECVRALAGGTTAYLENGASGGDGRAVGQQEDDVGRGDADGGGERGAGAAGGQGEAGGGDGRGGDEGDAARRVR